MTMANSSGWYRWEGDDLIVQVRVQPKASRDEFAEIQGDHLRIRITAPPVDGKANVHLCKFLAQVFQVPKSKVSLLSGETGREKRLRISRPRRLPAEITLSY